LFAKPTGVKIEEVK